jgi:hypothetical protein
MSNAAAVPAMLEGHFPVTPDVCSSGISSGFNRYRLRRVVTPQSLVTPAYRTITIAKEFGQAVCSNLDIAAMAPGSNGHVFMIEISQQGIVASAINRPGQNFPASTSLMNLITPFI